MVQLRYIGTHQPHGMIIDVDEDRAKELIKSGTCEYLSSTKKTTKVEITKDDSKLSKL